MIELGAHFQSLPFEKAAQGSEEMIGVGRNGGGGDLASETVCLRDL